MNLTAERPLGLEPPALPPFRGALQPWPMRRDVARCSDMEAGGFVRVGLDLDNDIFIEVSDGAAGAVIEFCAPGAGGGLSPRTRMALLNLMTAIESDNEESRALDWWATRTGDAISGGAGDARYGGGREAAAPMLKPAEEVVMQEIATEAVRFFGDPMSVALAAARGAWTRARLAVLGSAAGRR